MRPQPPSSNRPPKWLLPVLAGCLLCLCAAFFYHPAGGPQGAQAVETPLSTPSASPTPTPTPEPTPSPTPEPDWSQPIPEGEAVDQEAWFADAVFIGDSRIEGFQLYSGITDQASFLDYTGITVFDVAQNKAVIRQGKKKVSILDALGQQSYGKVYLSLGVNELGYFNPEGFAEAYGEVIDAVRECQPEAQLYVLSILPVNAKKCQANDVPYYITNEGVASYNETLSALCGEKKVRLVGIPETLVDENGETPADLSADGVHFKKEGYRLWLDYLIRHT